MEVAAVLRWDGVGDAEFLGDGGTGVGEKRIVEAVLLEGEVVLTGGLGRDGYEERSASAQVGVEIAPGFEFGDAVRIPATTEEVDDERAKREEVGRTDRFVGESVFESESRSSRPGFQCAVLDAGVEENFGRLFGDG